MPLAAGGFLLMPFLRNVYLLMLVSFAIGATFGVAPAFWMNALNLTAISWLARR